MSTFLGSVTLATAATGVNATSFLSTMAEVTATMVAIVGGFLLSRLIAAGTERRVLRREIEEEGVRRRRVAAEAHVLRQHLLQEDANAWLEDAIDLVVNEWGQVAIADVLVEFPSERDEEELRPFFDEAVNEVAAARERMDSWFVEGEPPPPDLEEIVDLAAMGNIKRLACWRVYMRLTNEFAQRPSMFLTIPFSRPTPDRLPPEFVVESQRVRRGKEEDLRDLRRDEKVAAARIERLEIGLRSREPLGGAWIGFSLLSAMTAIGVLAPLFVLSRLGTGLSHGGALALFIPLAVALIGLLAYVAYLLHAVTAHKHSRADTSAAEVRDHAD